MVCLEEIAVHDSMRSGSRNHLRVPAGTCLPCHAATALAYSPRNVEITISPADNIPPVIFFGDGTTRMLTRYLRIPRMKEARGVPELDRRRGQRGTTGETT